MKKLTSLILTFLPCTSHCFTFPHPPAQHTLRTHNHDHRLYAASWDNTPSFDNLLNKITENTNYISPLSTLQPPTAPEVDTSTLLRDTQSLLSDSQSFLLLTITKLLALPLLTKIALSLPPLLLTLFILSTPPPNYRDGYEPYPRGKYSPTDAKVYYANHPLLVVRRTLELLRISNGFIISLLVDNYITKSEERNRPVRATQLLELIQRAGPTAIKVGQALSVRPDLIPREYAEALTTLQDRVPPFPTLVAKAILKSELDGRLRLEGSGSSDDGNNEEETPSNSLIPVASASIGQVYKTTLPDGSSLAVKIQRPDALSSIALDLYIVKEYFAPLYKIVTRSATDYVSLANEWGRGFIAELDYDTERENSVAFNKEMAKRGLDEVVRAPRVRSEYCSERVLTTEWVEGKRLDSDLDKEAEEVTRLCGVALNAYLVMLLEIGTLHCDPHPGNLLRTPDGKLVILDFGMTLSTAPSLQYDLLDFVAHLTSRDYDRIPTDLVQLGFLKAERLETVVAAGFLEPLSFILRQASEGGGGSKVRERIFQEFRDKYPGLDDDELRVVMRRDMKDNIARAQREASAVSGITMEVEELQKRNRDAFRIPEWFLYTSRAFLTLEGICLQADEDYSLIQSCFPYVAGRLLKDDDERAQKALRDLLYGVGGSVVDVDRLTDVADGFSTYTTSTRSASRTTPIENTITLAKDSADILLSSKPNLVQNLLLEESTAAASASLKDNLKKLLVDNPRTARERFPFLPGANIETRLSAFLETNEDERKALDLWNRLLEKSRAGSSGVNGGGDGKVVDSLRLPDDVDAEQVAMIVKELRLNLPKYAPLVGQLGEKFATTLLEKTSKDIEQRLNQKQHDNETVGSDKNVEDVLVTNLARGLATVASQGANVIKRGREEEQRSSSRDRR